MARAFTLMRVMPDGSEEIYFQYGDATWTDEELEQLRPDFLRIARELGYDMRIYSPSDDDEPPTEDDLFWDSAVNE